LLPWLVITADRTDAGRGVRGQTLARFLRTYFSRRRVGLLTPDQWRRDAPQVDTLLVGLPTSLSPEELTAVASRGRARRIVPFDNQDQHELAWTADQAEALRPLAVAYLKPWREPAWNYDVPMGLLPIRRYGRFTAALALDSALGRRRRGPASRYDVAFVGRPNYTRMFVDGELTPVDQRFQWIRELRREAPELSFWGGLVAVGAETRRTLEASYGDVSDLLYGDDKVGFLAYWRAMRHSRVLLAPGGNVPWTYRHYECLYAGGVVATIDYRQRDMLVPLPRENMVHVPDGAPVLPAVREALELGRRRPTIGQENFAQLEQYLQYGGYSRRRPALLERFLAQLS
jgi:hypothetical protein